VPVLRAIIGRFEYAELAALFFLEMMALGMWHVPLGRILHNHGYTTLAPYAYATSALAAFISPLIFGAMADRHVSPVRILRWLSFASALGMAFSSYAIQEAWTAGAVLASIQAYAIVAVPTLSISSTIIFSRLRDSQRQFGPIRGVATIGWMVGCWLISALNVDSSPSAGYAGAVVWLTLAVFTYVLPAVAPSPSGRVTLRERMGWDALMLLKHPDHRVIFLAAALFTIPLAAFYPFTPPHLEQLGFHRTSAWMSLGQVTEVLTMFSLAGLLSRWRFKWVLTVGLFFGVLRYGFCALNAKLWLLAGVTLHGISFTLVFITAQIYLNERVEPAWRGRAQALMSLMNGGLGNLIGYLGTGFWFQTTVGEAPTKWPLFWGGLALAIACVLVFFVLAYRGYGTGLKRVGTIDKSTPG
jgi:nucleoside transporter